MTRRSARGSAQDGFVPLRVSRGIFDVPKDKSKQEGKVSQRAPDESEGGNAISTERLFAAILLRREIYPYLSRSTTVAVRLDKDDAAQLSGSLSSSHSLCLRHSAP